MIEVSSATVTVLSGTSWVYRLRVESWRDGVLLASDIPVSAGGEENDRTARIPERITLTVPREDGNTVWAPDSDDHPLAANGQRLRVMLGVGGRGRAVEWLQRGWFVVAAAEPSEDTVTVTGLGLLSLIDEARLVSPYQPTGTIGAAVRGLLEPALTVDLSQAPTDRAVPAGINIDEDRLQGVFDLLDAWGADGRVRPDGVFEVVESGQHTGPNVWVSRQTTNIQTTGTSTRNDAYNVVVARGTAADGGVVQGVAYETTGPKAYSGPFNSLPVPYFYSSPLLTTVTQCNTAAATVLERLRRTATQLYTVRMVTDPRLLPGDVALLGDGSSSDPRYAIESLQLPYLPDGGEMTIRCRGPL